MDITSYTRVQDGITSRANQCLNLYLLKRDKSKFWWILQLPAYQRGKAPDLSLQHMFVVILTMMMMLLLLFVVVVVAGGWTMLDNCCLHSHFTFAILFQALVSESTTSAVSIWKCRICHYSMFVVILTMMMMLLLLLLLLQEVGPCWTIVAYTHTLLLPSFFRHW